MFPIGPRQAALASASNTCTPGIMTLHFPFSCSPQWAKQPCKVTIELNGAEEAQYKLTPRKHLPLNNPHNTLRHTDTHTQTRTPWTFLEREDCRGPTPCLPGSLSACKITPAPQVSGLREKSKWVWGEACAFVQMALHLWSRLKSKKREFWAEIEQNYATFVAHYHWRHPVEHTVDCSTVGHDHCTHRQSMA